MYPVELKRWRLSRLEALSGVRFCAGSITESAFLASLWSEYGPFDAVVNLAARAGVRQSIHNPHVYYEVNVLGTLNLLEFCRHHNVKKFILASTSSVYGHGPRPFCEDQLTDRPLSPYAASKKAAEVLGYSYHQLFGIDVIVFRYFTVYGPAGRPDMSIFRFIHRVAEGLPVTVYGDGTQERDFTYIDDIARGTVAGLRLEGFHVINLGNDRPVRVNEVLRIVEALLGQQARVVHQPRHPADVEATWADITRARQLLGWEPTVPVEIGLKRAVSWYLENREWVRNLPEVGD